MANRASNTKALVEKTWELNWAHLDSNQGPPHYQCGALIESVLADFTLGKTFLIALLFENVALFFAVIHLVSIIALWSDIDRV